MRVGLATASHVPPSDQDDEPLLAALAAAGHEGSLVDWSDADVDWAAFDTVLIRTAWDSHLRRDEFLTWTVEVEGRTQLWNGAEVARWNTHKGYLLELEERGAPLVPTAWLAAGDRVDLADLATDRGWSEVVVKPAVGAGGDGVVRTVARGGQQVLDDALAAGDVLVQPYLRTIERAGETSVVVIDGQVSHAIRKVPAAGAFLVQIEHGGRYEVLDRVPPEAAALAAWTVEATGHDLLFARVDLVQDELGGWMLSELEVTEPGLFMHLADGSAQRLVAAVERRHRRSK